jgi:hypothetical protein
MKLYQFMYVLYVKLYKGFGNMHVHFFDLRILITALVSSNSSLTKTKKVWKTGETATLWDYVM